MATIPAALLYKIDSSEDMVTKINNSVCLETRVTSSMDVDYFNSLNDLSKYKVLGTIGEGAFGSVERIQRLSDGRELVWKVIDYGKMSDEEKEQLVQEVNILQKLRNSSNVVRYYERIIDRSNAILYIVMEYCSRGDLAELIRRCRRKRIFVDEQVIWKILTQLALAVRDCHRSDGIILHRDIKPKNVFLDEENNAKLGDFGLSCVLSKRSRFSHACVGTPLYMSPEQVTGRNYNEKCDIWSLGCLIYELAALNPPFVASNQYDLIDKIKIGEFARIPDHYSDDLQRVISSMLKVRCSERADIDVVTALLCIREQGMDEAL